MPHVGPLRSKEGGKCSHEKRQSPGEDGSNLAEAIDGEFPPGLVTLATTSKDEVKLLQELGFQLIEIAPATPQPVAAGENDDQTDVRMVEVGGLSLMLDIPGVIDHIRVVVMGTELVQELRQFLVERNESVYRTCIGLYHKGARLEEFMEIASIEGVADGSVIKFEEEPYTLREARIHVCRVKELLTDSIDLLTSGSDGLSLSFLSHITITNPEEEVNKISGGDTSGLTSNEIILPPNYCLPSEDIKQCCAPPLSAFYPHGYHNKPPDCLKALHYNNHNPPSSRRKLRGDLFYLTVHTLEGQDLGITSCHSGFYVNKSSGDHFDPNPAKLAHYSHHLIGVFNQISPLFKKNFALLQKQTSKRHTLEILPSPFKVYPWLVPQLEHVADNYFTLEGVFGTKVNVEEQFVGQSQDWNEQFQTIKEMTTENVAQKVLKDKAYYKLYMEYCSVAVKGAIAAVDGNIPPINCSEHVKQRMFIWNNIFFTFAFDGRDNYSDIGGDEAAWRAASHDLANLSILNTCEAPGIYSSATVVVDYRGYRVTAQTIIPGILSHTQDDCVAYGTMDNGKSISNHERFLDKLKPVAKEFYLKEEHLLDQNGQEVSLVSSMDVKGIIGQDNRCYVLDLFRMLPADANWFRWPKDCNVGKREKGQASSGDNKTSSTTCDTISDTDRTTVSMGTGVVTAPDDLTSDALGVERTQTIILQHTGGDSPKDKCTHISSDDVTSDDTHYKTGDPVEEDNDSDMPSGEGKHVNTPKNIDSNSTSPKHSDTLLQEVTHTNGITSDIPVDRKANTDGDTDTTVSTPIDTAQGEQTTDIPNTSDETEDIMESVTTPGAARTTRSVGTTTSSNEEKNRRILEKFIKRMKESQHGHLLKLLRPELVKAFIHCCSLSKKLSLLHGVYPAVKVLTREAAHLAVTPGCNTNGYLVITGDATVQLLPCLTNSFKRIIYVQVLSATMEAVKRKKEQNTSAKKDGDHVINDDVIHPPEMTNGIAEDRPHPSNLTNDIHQFEPPQSPTNTVKTSLDESHSDLLSKAIPDLVNDTCSPTEHSEATTSAANSANQNSSDHEAEAVKLIGANLNKEAYLDIKFNIDLFTPGAHHNKSEEELHKDYQLLTDISNFLIESVIPKMVQDCSQLLVVPSDGESLRNVMHARGINMRYLGLIAELSVQRPNLDHLYRLCVIEMISRTAKRILQKDMQQASLHNVVTVVVYFFNCYLGVPADGTTDSIPEEPKKKNKKKRKAFGRTESLSLVHTKESLWSLITKMVEDHFCYKLNWSSLNELCNSLHINKIVLLRRLCKCVGVQLVLREYHFTTQPTFTDEDICNLLPVIRIAQFKPSDGSALFELATSQVSSGNFSDAHEMTSQAMGIYSQVFGPLHYDIANCYRLMARIHFLANESVPAMCFQHKAVMVFERVLGVDHPDTVSAYVNLALYCHHCDQTQVALRLMYRAHYLISLMFGDDSPEIATCDSNIALMLHSCKEYSLSISYLEHALKLNTKYHGDGSIQVALNHHLIARGQSFTGDFRLALQHEKITYNIYKEKFGESHHRTVESAECLQQLTEKAVKMQKKINEITSKFPSSSRPTVSSSETVASDKTNKSSKAAAKKKSRSGKGEGVKGTTTN